MTNPEISSPQPAQALLAQALEDIIEPFAYIERNLPEGYRLDGQAALQQINSREFYTRIAKEALAAHRAAVPAPEGGLPTAVQRALSAWDTTTLKTSGDGMLSEAMETLRAEFGAALAAQHQATLAEPDNVQQLPPPKSYPRLADLAGDIRAAIDKHNGELPLASVLGVLEIIKARMIEENTP